MLLKHTSDIESHLQQMETHLFNLEEKVLLYDLTNIFFEGSGKYAKAHFGHSKEKRSDSPLVTLGLLLDADRSYHVLHSIRLQLKKEGITYNRATIRNRLSTHFRVTTSISKVNLSASVGPDGRFPGKSAFRRRFCMR